MATARRLFADHPELGLLPLGVVAVLVAGLAFSMTLWQFCLLLVVAAMVSGLSFRRWGDALTGRRLHARTATQVTVLGIVAYATGWGPALALTFVVAIADAVRHSGAAAARPAYDWSLVAIATGQLLVEVGVLPSLIPTPGAHGVALLAALVLGVVSQRIKQMTARVEAAEAEARAGETRFRALVARASDVVLVLDGDGVVTYQGPSARTVLGWDDDALVGRPLLELAAEDDRERVGIEFADIRGGGPPRLIEMGLTTSAGSILAAEVAVRDLRDDPDVGGIVCNVRDVSERRSLEEQLQHRAFHDALTGLANRHLFRDRVSHAVARAQRHDRPFAVLFVDLDGFKQVNDSLGHAAGDHLLMTVAHRLKKVLRTPDTASRLGGDEFGVLLEDLTDDADAARVANRIIEALSQPIRIGGNTVAIGASIGMVISRNVDSQVDVGQETDLLVRNADIAMYIAKDAGKGRYAVYEPSMHERVKERLELESDLQRALDRDELTIFYQPIVTLADGEMTGVEALIRWNHPTRGTISPAEFVPLAEETGMIVQMGSWILREACMQIAAWNREFGKRLSVSVNVSARQLSNGDLVRDVAAALALSGLESDRLCLEITETALLTDVNTARRLFIELKGLGVRLAIDDFGTGYSSLAYLQSFPFDTLKIDKSFIDGLSAGTQAPAVVRAIVDLGRSLHLETVAEGIEFDEQLVRFRELHCTHGQGYLFARPAPADELTAQMRGVTAPAPQAAPSLPQE